MSIESNKATARRIYSEVWSKGDMDAAREIFKSDYVDHGALPGSPPGIDGLKELVGTFRSAFPDFHITVEDQIAEDNFVAGRWIMHGTHQGVLFGIPPTGKEVTVTGISVLRFEDGKVAEDSPIWDTLGMMRQLGVVPAPGGH
jgi:steroid delta-isomerase-like uncharacterized protein